MQTFCTLFNVNYLDKGLTVYDSLVEVGADFELYVLAMDDRCYEIISDLNYPHLIPIKLTDFENEDLLRVKMERSAGEYCWTCSSALVKYILETFKPTQCAYIDADMYFYDDPKVMLEEMQRRNASVQITGHRFYPDVAKKMSWRVGRYCVEYNTFLNNKEGNELLDIWANQCLEYCATDGDGIHWADQKYMDNWVTDYEYAIETENLGAGVAPWNIGKYKLVSADRNNIQLDCEGTRCRLLFYHFQSITYVDEHTANINAYSRRSTESKLVDLLYRPYLQHIQRNKQLLKEKYGVEVLLTSHPGVKKPNVFMRMKSKLAAAVRYLYRSCVNKNTLYYSSIEAKKLNIMKF